MEWFESWFNTSYYHQLYANRNEEEAKLFLNNLLPYLPLDKSKKIVDVCCGKGRHSLTINQLGYDVLGFDLSEESIREAKKLENNRLFFCVHDVRNTFFTNYFDCALNLFTSFGYFEKSNDNHRALKAIHKSLKDNGLLVIDFLNAPKVKESICEKEIKNIGGLIFNLSKKIIDGWVIKEITFTDKGKKHQYFEKVKLLELADFQDLLHQNGFIITETFGNYHLQPYTKESDRLIILAQKK